MREGQRLDGRERITHRAHAACFGRPQYRREYAREQVNMLVRVQVRDAQAVLLDPADLRLSFGCDLTFVQAAAERSRRESQPAITKARADPIRNHQARNILRRQHGLAIDQNYVAAGAQVGVARARDRVVHRAGISHHCGRRHHASLVRFYDGTVHPGGQPEVVSVDDQPPHAASVRQHLCIGTWHLILVCCIPKMALARRSYLIVIMRPALTADC